MATTTMHASPISVEREARAERGFFRRVLDNMIAARERDARRHIAQALWAFDDARLNEMGFTREELSRWHAAR